MDNEDDEASAEVSVEHATTSDVFAVESVCKEIGLVMCANKSSRLVNTVVYYNMLLVSNWVMNILPVTARLLEICKDIMNNCIMIYFNVV